MPNYFINPYTFVPLGAKRSVYVDNVPDDEKLTGYVECTLTTRSQISIPDNSTEEDKYRINKVPFFSVNGKAVIPGSSLRGVIRNVYETLTNSCLSHINNTDKDFFSSRMNKNETGLLAYKDGKYFLSKATRYIIYDGSDRVWNIGDPVKADLKRDGTIYQASNVRKASDYGAPACFFTRSNVFKNKGRVNHPSVFKENGDKKIEVSQKAIDALEYYIEKMPERNKITGQFSECFKKMKEGKAVLPVWYFKDGDKIYLASSQMSRAVFIKKPKDLITEYSACKNDNEPCCPACHLFGYIGGDKMSVAHAGKLRFSDAVCVSDDPFDGYRILPILSNPRLSSFEFYLKNTNIILKNGLLKTPSPDDAGTQIAGRKFYWHHGGKEITSDDQKSIENAKKFAQTADKRSFPARNSDVELVKSGKEFKFKIFFDKIDPGELDRLIFALTLGENDPESKQCHKIGHGKPVGLGSVKITADKITIRHFSNGVYKLEERPLPDLDDVKKSFDENTLRAVKRVTNLNAVDAKLISYPHTSSSGDIFKWFQNNRLAFRNDKKGQTVTSLANTARHLPDILGSDGNDNSDQRLDCDLTAKDVTKSK